MEKEKDNIDASPLKIEQEKLEKTVNVLTDGKYWVLEVCLSVMAQMLIDGIKLPFFLILIGAASSYKTTILSILEAIGICYKSDSFTPKSFVSHMASIKEKDLAKIDLLPRIKGRTLLTLELGPTFSAKEDKLQENFGILTRLLDGQGYWSESGARGGRGYRGDYHFTWIGATVSVPRHVWKVIGNLGPKIYFVHIHGKEITDEEQEAKILQKMESDSYLAQLEEAKKQVVVVWDLMKKFPEQRNGKIVWNKEKDNPETKKRLVSLAMLLGRLRTLVHYEEVAGQVQSRASASEDPSRAATLLQYLSRGHAVQCERNYIIDDDLGVAIRVALSSAYRERVDLFRALLQNNGVLNTDEVMQVLNVRRQTALNSMRELELVGLVEDEQQEADTKPYSAIRLKKVFSWLLSKEYEKYWEE